MMSLIRYKSVITLLVALLFAPLAFAVVTVLDPGGTPVPNQTITITLPGGEVKEGETDDDGILFWWIDGKRVGVDELPAGTKLSNGYTFAVKTGMSTAMKVGLGVVGAGVIAVVANDDDGSSTEVSPPPTTTPPPPTTDPAMLSVTPSSLSLSREMGSPCPVDVGSFSVENTGDDTLNYTVSPSASGTANFDYEDQGNSVSGNSSDTVGVNFTCEDGDNTGTFTVDITFDAGDAGMVTRNVQVETTAAPVAPGMLVNAGPTEFVKVHVAGVDSCPDPFGVIRITNTGGETITFSLEGPAFVSASTTSGTVSPGDTIEIEVEFPCGGFAPGLNTGSVVIGSTSLNDGSMDTGTVTIPIELTVN